LQFTANDYPSARQINDSSKMSLAHGFKIQCKLNLWG